MSEEKQCDGCALLAARLQDTEAHLLELRELVGYHRQVIKNQSEQLQALQGSESNNANPSGIGS